MQPAHIAERLEPYLGGANGQRLTVSDLQRISTYIDILMRWNARINLTAIRTEEEIVTRHFGESLFAAHHLFPLRELKPMGRDKSLCRAESSESGRVERSSTTAAPSHELDRGSLAGLDRGRAAPHEPALSEPGVTNPKDEGASAPAVADLGTGAGFPGIPLKLWAPSIQLTLIESNHKKAAFLREVARALTLTDINILSARAETLSPATFSLVTLRAVERFENVLAIAARLVAPGGRLALLIGQGQLHRVQAVLPHLCWEAPVLIPESNARVLLLGSTRT